MESLKVSFSPLCSVWLLKKKEWEIKQTIFFSLFVKVYFGFFFLFIHFFLYSVFQTELYFPGR